MLVSASLIFQGSEISTLCDDINVALSLGGLACIQDSSTATSLICICFSKHVTALALATDTAILSSLAPRLDRHR